MSDGCQVQGASNRNNGKGFALIVVLFILLIIVGAAAFGGCNNVSPSYGKGCGYGGYGGY